MRDGSLILRYEAGKILEVSINPGLEAQFESIFRSALRAVRRNPESLKNGIAIIVFGAFWIEAYCNYCLRSLLKLRKEIGSWKSLERKPIGIKFRSLLGSANRKQQNQFRSFKKNLDDVFDLRDRLAHFKEEDFRISGPLSAEEFLEFAKICPEPGLIRKLKGESVKGSGQSIVQAGIWLKKVYKQFCSKYDVKVTEHKPGRLRQPDTYEAPGCQGQKAPLVKNPRRSASR